MLEHLQLSPTYAVFFVCCGDGAQECVCVFERVLPKKNPPRFLDWVPIFGNCRRYSLYLDEDMVGRAKSFG